MENFLINFKKRAKSLTLYDEKEELLSCFLYVDYGDFGISSKWMLKYPLRKNKKSQSAQKN